MKRITVLSVLILALVSAALLTACGSRSNDQTDRNDQTTQSTPGSTTNGTANNGSTHNGNSAAGDIVDGVIEGGEDIMNGVGDALDGNNTVPGGVTYDDMVRNGRFRDSDGFIDGR